jgi:hypothetical protein
MTRIASILFVLTAVVTPDVEAADSRFPWQFDMSPAEVQAQGRFGPYKAFSNGDLETYNGLFNGRAENFQFFFSEQKLRRIGIYLYEGASIDDAASKWLGVFDTMTREFGPVETPGNDMPSPGNDSSRGAFASRAKAIVAPGAKTQIAPVQQPSDAVVFSSFWASDFQNTRTYFVVVYFDRPPNNRSTEFPRQGVKTDLF